MKKLSFLRLALATAGFWLAAGLLTHAQTPTTGGPAPQTPAAVPLDGGASLLVAAGVGLGWRKLRSRRRAGSSPPPRPSIF